MSDFSIRGWLGLNNEDFNKNLSKSKTDAKKMGTDVSGVGNAMSGAFLRVGLAVGGVTGALRLMVGGTTDAIEAASKITDLASQLEISARSLQEYEFAFTQTGGSAEEFSKALVKMSQVREKAMEGDAEAIETFRRLGVTIDDLKGKSTEEIFEAVGKSLAGIQDPMTRLAVTTEIFGKKGMSLLPAFKEGLDGLKDSARGAGQVMDEASRIGLEKSGDHLDAFKRRATNTWAAIAESAISPIETIQNLFSKLGEDKGGTIVAQRFRGLSLDKQIEEFNRKKALAEAKNKPAEETTKERVAREKREAEEAKKKAERISKLSEDVAKMQREFRLEEMTAEKRLQTLIAERGELQKKIFTDQEKQLENTKKIFELTDQIKKTEKATEKKPEFFKPNDRANEMIRSGGFNNIFTLAAAFRGVGDVGQAQIRLQRDIAANTRRTAENTGGRKTVL